MNSFPQTSQRRLARRRRQGLARARAVHRSRHDDRPDREGRRQWRQVRRRRLFLFAPHVDIDSSDDDLKRLADKVRAKDLVIGSVVAPVWRPHRRRLGDGRRGRSHEVPHAGAQGLPDRARSCASSGVRPYGVVRIDSRPRPGDWLKDPEGNQKKIAETFRKACDIAEGYRRTPGRRRAKSAGAACIAGSGWCSCSS